MKLATYQDGSRDGQLVVVARDLSMAHYASDIASHLQAVLDDWNFLAPQLQDLYDSLNAGRARHAFPFEPRQCMAPLPRAGLWALADAYDAGLSDQPPADAGLRFGPGHGLSGPCDALVCAAEAWQMDFGAALAVVTGDLQARATPEQALDGVRLLLLANAVQLHAPGLSQAQRQPRTAFGPVAVTLDELGEAWEQGRVHLPLQTHWNGRRFGLGDAGADMRWHFGELLAQLCATRPLPAGSIVGAGPVRNRPDGEGGQRQWPRGSHAIADRRANETALDGAPASAFLRLGDSVRIEMKGRDGQSLFGAIEQEVVAPVSAQGAAGLQ